MMLNFNNIYALLCVITAGITVIIIVYMLLKSDRRVKIGKDSAILGGKSNSSIRTWVDKVNNDYNTISAKLDAALTNQREMNFNVMRLLILNDNLPLNVQSDIYDKYKSLGGNTWMDAYVAINLKPRIDQTLQETKNE
jgi:hypothetical protein